MPRWFACVLLAASVAGAQSPGVTWTAPAGCPTTEEFRASVERLLRRPVAELPPGLAIDAQVVENASRWRLELAVTRDGGAAGTRSIEGESCAALLEAGATIVALVVQEEERHDAAEEGTPSDVPPATTPPPMGAPPPAPKVAPAPAATGTSAGQPPAKEPEPGESPRTPRVGGLFDAAFVLDTTSLPRPALGGELAAGIRGQTWTTTLGVVALMPSKTDIREGATASLWLVTGRLNGCRLWRASGALRVASCGALEAGWVQGQADGIRDAGAGGTMWLAVGPGLHLTVDSGDTSRIDLGVLSGFPLRRTQFEIEDTGQPVHRLPIAAVRWVLGWTVEFD